MNLTTLLFETRPVRMTGHTESPLFVAVDVGDVLELRNVRSTVALFDPDERGVHTMDTPSGQQEMLCVTEAGLYRLIFRSRKEAAKRFQKWIFSEVIPSLRRTGTYSVNGAGDSLLGKLDRLTGVLERLVTATEPVAGGRETWPDRYHAPALTLEEIILELGPGGDTRARYRAGLVLARNLSPTVVDGMIDAAIFGGLIDENTNGPRIILNSTRAAWSLYAKEVQAQKRLGDEVVVLEGREDGR